MTTSFTPPHRRDGHVARTRRGQFWIPGERVTSELGTQAVAPMYVRWEAPAVETDAPSLILVHGGGGQGTNWTGTPDGRPGWADHLVAAGHPVYIVDRCGHGRSPYHPDVVGPMGAQIGYEAAGSIFFPAEYEARHTQWTYGRDIGADGVDQLVSAMGPMPADWAAAQRMDTDRLVELLRLTGPAILLTHSAGGPLGWLCLDRSPDLVTAVVAIEPVGPPFAQLPGLGTLEWGLTSAPIGYAEWHSPGDARAAAPERRVIPAMRDKPTVVVTGEASPFADFADEIVDFLHYAGSSAERLHLPHYGVFGNGHGLMFEANSADTVVPVIDWIRNRIP